MAEYVNNNNNVENITVDDLKRQLDNGKYEYVESKWRFISGKERLELMEYCLEQRKFSFIDDRHFEIWQNDGEILEEALKEYAKKFEMSKLSIASLEVFFDKKARGDSSIRRFMVYKRLKDYYELTEKYPFFSKRLIAENKRILRCDPRRTDARIQFLAECSPEDLERKYIFSEIVDTNKEFNFRHQYELEDKIETLKGRPEYNFIAELAEKDSPAYPYAKFLEYAIRAIYNDYGLINSMRRKGIEFEQKAPGEGKKEKVDDSKGKKVGNKTVETVELSNGMLTSIPVGPDGTVDEKSLQEIWDRLSGKTPQQSADGVSSVMGAFLPDPQNNHGHTSGLRPGTKGLGKREPLDKDKIGKFIEDVKELGFECDGRVERSSGGYLAKNEDTVIYYTFSQGNYRVLEPVGQPNNRTLIMYMRDEENFSEIVKTNSITDLIVQRKLFRLNHDTQDVYNWSPYRLANILQIIGDVERSHRKEKTKGEIGLAQGIEESAKSEKAEKTVGPAELTKPAELGGDWTREKLKEEITKSVPREEIPEATKYIKNVLSLVTTRRIKKHANELYEAAQGKQSSNGEAKQKTRKQTGKPHNSAQEEQSPIGGME